MNENMTTMSDNEVICLLFLLKKSIKLKTKKNLKIYKSEK